LPGKYFRAREENSYQAGIKRISKVSSEAKRLNPDGNGVNINDDEPVFTTVKAGSFKKSQLSCGLAWQLLFVILGL